MASTQGDMVCPKCGIKLFRRNLKQAILKDIQNNTVTSQTYLKMYSSETGIVTPIFGKAPSIDDDFWPNPSHENL